MKTFLITEDEVKAILAYLAKRPWEEVVNGINMLSKLPEVSGDGPTELSQPQAQTS